MPPDEGIVNVKATFRVIVASLEPDAVSRLLAITPDDSHRCGDLRKNKARRPHYSYIPR
jgi:hypothetical protein